MHDYSAPGGGALSDGSTLYAGQGNQADLCDLCAVRIEAERNRLMIER